MECELCQSLEQVNFWDKGKEFETQNSSQKSRGLQICTLCRNHLKDAGPNYWKCLESAIWSENPWVKILSYQILGALKKQAWAMDLWEQIYLEAAELEEAQRESFDFETSSDSGQSKPCKDSFGNLLQEGDAVTLIKDLDVKGTSFVAKRGTLVKNIKLTDNPEHIEGRVEGTQIVILTKFVKKA